jgi:hypothetical protein
MSSPKSEPAVLIFYAYTLTLCAVVLCRDVPLVQGITQTTELATLAWMLVNRRQLAED